MLSAMSLGDCFGWDGNFPLLNSFFLKRLRANVLSSKNLSTVILKFRISKFYFEINVLVVNFVNSGKEFFS